MAADASCPEWLDNGFFEGVLREDEDDAHLVVTDADVCLAVGKGENYVSVLHRATVHVTKDGKPGERHLIVKSLPESEMLVKFAKDGGIFEKETSMYLQTFPALRALQEAAGTPSTPLACKCYRTSRPHTIVMEDLTKTGFVMAARQEGLDLAHSTLAVQGLARLHALSRGLLVGDPRSLDEYTEKLYVPEKRALCHQFLDPNITALAAKIDTWPGYERFGDKLRKVDWVDGTLGLFEKIKEDDAKGFAALNHGDCWVNNMMFRRDDEGTPKEVMFVDFQIARFASLAVDLQYFLHTSPKEAVRLERWDELLDAYHATYVETWKSIGLDASTVFSVAQLREEVDAKRFFGMLTVFIILPIVLADPKDAPDMSQLTDYDSYEKLEDKSSFSKAYDGSKFRSVIQNSLVYFESLGML